MVKVFSKSIKQGSDLEATGNTAQGTGCNAWNDLQMNGSEEFTMYAREKGRISGLPKMSYTAHSSPK